VGVCELDIIGLVYAILWFVIAGLSITFSVIFFMRYPKAEFPRTRYTYLVNAIFFLLIGATKLFDLLFVNMAAEAEPIPLFPIFTEDVLHYLALVEMTIFLSGYAVLIFFLERYFVKTYYLLTFLPIVAICVAWIFNIDMFIPDLMQLDIFGTESTFTLIFYACRVVVPLVYLYVAIKSTGVIRKTSIALFFGYALIATFYVRHPEYWALVTPPLMVIGFYLVYWGYLKRRE